MSKGPETGAHEVSDDDDADDSMCKRYESSSGDANTAPRCKAHLFSTERMAVQAFFNL